MSETCAIDPSTFGTLKFNFRSPWPFVKWGLDIIGKLPTAKGGKCSVLLAMDYFTNLVDAEAYSKVTANDVINFIWKHLICRFKMPKFLVMDNGT